jgi:hypothetical protein
MHTSSLDNMRAFIEKYLDRNSDCRILDVGSQEVPGEVNGSYRRLFCDDSQSPWKYVGADMVQGNNVDIVLKNVYRWREIPSKSFDVVICGQVFEHAEYFWLTALEINRVLKPGGLCCIIAPSGGSEHRFPTDCYRFYPDGMRAVARYAGLEVLEVYAQWNRKLYPQMDPEWRDCVLIAKKNMTSSKSFAWKTMFMNTLFPPPSEIDNSDVSAGVNTYEPPWAGSSITTNIYFDTGSNFNEDEVFHGSGGKFEITIPNGCRRIRFDPLEGSYCIVRNLKIETDQDAAVIAGHNGEYIENIGYLFLRTHDPQMLILLPETSRVLKIEATIDTLS